MQVMRLPAELLRPIFASVDSKQTLYSLCLVSRLFHSEGVRILYESVEVSLRDESSHRWWNTIANNARLALLVKSLKVSAGNMNLDCHEPVDLKRVLLMCEGLQALDHLRELDLETLPEYVNNMRASERIVEAGTLYRALTRCRFRLRRCTLRNASAFRIDAFLANQPEIHDFTYDRPEPWILQDDMIDMPSLTTLNTPATVLPLFTTPHPLRRARIHFPKGEEARKAERNALAYLETVRGTLQSLRVDREAVKQYQWTPMPLDRLVANFANKLSGLNYFSLMDERIVILDDADAQRTVDFCAAFAQFATLETLVLDTGRKQLPPGGSVHDRTLEAIATLLTRACPSLKKVLFSGLGEAPVVCCVRSSYDEVTAVEGGDDIRAADEDYWRYAT